MNLHNKRNYIAEKVLIRYLYQLNVTKCIINHIKSISSVYINQDNVE